jgi:hypothetical protein
MKSNEKFRRRHIAIMYRMCTQEESVLGKARISSKICVIIGGLMIFAAMLEAFEPHWPIWAIVACGVVGGMTYVIGVRKTQAVRDWHFLKPFINVNAIVEAKRNTHLQE